MKNNIKIFLTSNLLCGVFTFIGTLLGNAVGQTGLFIGGMIGGICGVILSAFFLQKNKAINRDSFLSVVTWGTVFFLSATLFAVTNLNSPIIPAISLSFVGLGCMIGSTYKLVKERAAYFYRALFGYVLILPAVYFVVGSLVKYNLGFEHSFTLLQWLQSTTPINVYFAWTSPFIFIGGLLLCIALNVPIRRLLKGTVYAKKTLFTVPKPNLFVTLTSCLFLMMITLYLVMENG